MDRQISMRLPKKLDIHGKIWNMKYKWNLQDDDGVRCDGLCDKKDRLIWIDRSLDKEDKKNTFLHEMFHAINYELKLNQSSLSHDVEEIQAQGFADFLCENFNLRWKSKRS